MVDVNPVDEETAEEAVHALNISEAHGKVQAQLTAAGGNPTLAFTFEWLTENPEVLTWNGGVGLDLDSHSECLLSKEFSCRASIID